MFVFNNDALRIKQVISLSINNIKVSSTGFSLQVDMNPTSMISFGDDVTVLIFAFKKTGFSQLRSGSMQNDLSLEFFC